MKAYREVKAERGITQKWAVSFTPRPLYPRGNSFRCSLNRMLGGLQILRGSFGEHSNLCHCRAALRLITIPTTLLVVQVSDLKEDWYYSIFCVKSSNTIYHSHPAFCKMGTGSFPRVKCGRGLLLTTHPLLVPRSWKSRAIPLPTLWATPGL